MITSSLDELPILGVSHNPEIKKQVMIPNGVIPMLTNFSQSRFQEGQVCHAHIHSDMWEVYLVEAGTLTMTCNGKTSHHEGGSCVAIEPGEEHAASNTHSEELVLTYFGLVDWSSQECT